MEATRETYWNIGHGMIAPMYFFVFIAIAVLPVRILPALRHL
jgi:hypothetical protein